MLGVVSMTQPAAIRMKIIIRMITVGSSLREVTAPTKPCGTPMIASACASGSENAMIGRMTPTTLAELSSIDGKSDSFRVLSRKPMMTVTMTAVAPASVGVRRPEKMP